MDLDKKHATSSDLQQLLALRERVGDLVSEYEETSFKVDLLELDDAYQVTAELPGVAQSDLEVALQGRHLTIAGVVAPHEPDARLLLQERASGRRQRVIELPGDVIEKRTSARLSSGLLTLHLPKE